MWKRQILYAKLPGISIAYFSFALRCFAVKNDVIQKSTMSHNSVNNKD